MPELPVNIGVHRSSPEIDYGKTHREMLLLGNKSFSTRYVKTIRNQTLKSPGLIKYGAE